MAVQQIHENDTILIYNPTNRDFSVKWGGVTRTIRAKEEAQHPRFLAEHFAKHLADFILQVKEYKYKKEHGKQITLLRNTKERERVLRLIVRGVQTYFMPATADGTQSGDQIQPLTAEEQRALIDLGDVDDDVMGRTIDDVEVDLPPEAIGDTDNMTKQQVMDQLTILGVEFSDRETKPELLKKLGVQSTGTPNMDNVQI